MNDPERLPKIKKYRNRTYRNYTNEGHAKENPNRKL